eukprot:Partr_v1_DN28903_c3_g1_i3_m26234 putative four and A half lim domains
MAESIKCPGCGKPTILGINLLQIGTSKWHQICVKCGSCQKSLVNQELLEGPSTLLCSNCYDLNRFVLRCKGCKNSISDPDAAVQAFGFPYHKICVVCSSCKRQVATGEGFYDDQTDEVMHLSCLK